MSQTTISPHTLAPLVTRQYPSIQELDKIIQAVADAQKEWQKVSLNERITIAEKFIEEFIKLTDEIAEDLTASIGRPISQNGGEVRGTLERARYMISIARQSLADVELKDTDKPGFRRLIKRCPLGVVLVIAPWNYPYLTSINSVLPALISGNSVLLKPSPQTPISAELLQRAFLSAGVPPSVLQVIHLSPDLTARVVASPFVNFISFTGSVATGALVEKEAAGSKGFKGVALELGGKDPAYVRHDADLDYTIAELVDVIQAHFLTRDRAAAPSRFVVGTPHHLSASYELPHQRIYVHESVYDEFVGKFVDLAKAYKLGDPQDKSTNLGPVVNVASADKIRKQVDDAVKAGAKALVPEHLFGIAKAGTAFVAPQVLVSSDAEALQLMNDSAYGLTASIWTKTSSGPGSDESQKAFEELADKLETGTVFLNRYVDMRSSAW
ncbi:hypothetical protein FRB97_002457 [Tulasnella sp. 331]|nr:hypothetical protein FRB97_002457 [Tulasnella sp. 331]